MTFAQSLKKITSKWLGFLILFILFAFLNYNNDTLLFSREEGEVSVDKAFVAREFRGMVSWSKARNPGELNTVYGEDRTVLGFFFLSGDNRWQYSGYAGPVPIMVKLDPTLRVSEVLLLDNRETPRFLSQLYARNFLESWNGMTLEEAAESPIDTISGVTLTSRTVIANFSEFLEEYDGYNQMGQMDRRKIIYWTLEALVLILALLNFFGRRLRRFRIVQLILNVLVFGFLAGDFISMAMLSGFLTGAVSFLSNPILWIIFLLSLALPVVTDKSFYCAHLCPFGSAQDLVGRMRGKKRKLTGKILKVSSIFRPVIFGLVSLIIILDYDVDLSLTEPFAAFLFTVAAPLTLFLAGASLVASLFYSRPWCRWFCPTGQMLEYFRTNK